MKIENTFTVDAPIEEAWELLTNIPEIAPCLPGAKLTDEVDGVYSGGIKVKVGPVTSEYKGSAHFVEKDDANYKAVIDGKGRDVRGAGNAQALITAQMTPEGDKTKVDIETDLKVSGKVAQFGRGVMQDVSTKLLGKFAECLEEKIGEPATIDGIAAASAEADAESDAASSAEAEATEDAGTSAATDSADASSADSDSAAADDAATSGGAKPAAAGAAAAVATGAAASKISSSDDTASDDTASKEMAMSDDDDDEEVLDLLDVAGGAVFERLIPVAIAVLIAITIIVWFIGR